MAITVPWSLRLPRNGVKAEATAGTTSTVVAGHLLLFLGASVDPHKRTSISTTITMLLRHLLSNGGRGNMSGNVVVTAPVGGSKADVSMGDQTTTIAAGNVALVVSSTFITAADTHHLTNITHMLQDRFQELSMDN